MNTAATTSTADARAAGRYATVNGFKVYYEVHGTGPGSLGPPGGEKRS